jgi:hypothetical protein
MADVRTTPVPTRSSSPAAIRRRCSPGCAPLAAACGRDGQSSTSRSTAGVVVDSGAAEPNPRAEPKRYTLPSSVST